MLLTAEAGKVVADMLATNTVLKVLDLSSNNWMQYGTYGDPMGDGPGFAKELTVGISGNGALLVLNISNNDLRLSGCKVLAEAISKSQIASLDVSNSRLTWNDNGEGFSMAGIIDLANAIKDMRAMTSLNLASNMIGSEGAKHIAEAIKVSVLLRLVWYQFHAHLTNGSTAVVCHCPQDMGALTSLNLSSNYLKSEGTNILAEAIKVTNC
jgi:hypothetical protein